MLCAAESHAQKRDIKSVGLCKLLKIYRTCDGKNNKETIKQQIKRRMKARANNGSQNKI